MPIVTKSTAEITHEYLESVKKLNVEAARSQRFTSYLAELIGSESEFYQDYVGGLEYSLSTGVKLDKVDCILRGRADSLIGNVIVEFEGSLPLKLNEATEQLKKYTTIQWVKEGYENRRPYICIATDGERFYSYTPTPSDEFNTCQDPCNVVLTEIEMSDWTCIEPDQALFWIDRYFLRKERLTPSSDLIEKDFGSLSHAFLTSSNELLSAWEEVHENSAFAVMFDNWDKYLRIVYGEKVAGADLFIRHTYLATLAKLMVWVNMTKSPPSKIDEVLTKLLNGEFFQKHGLDNFLEEDFFSWLSRSEVNPVAVKVARRLVSLLDKFDFDKLSEDVIKALYQDLVDPETRHDLGEFYTPDWLAHLIINKFMDENPHGSFLDPACGSGTFLYLTIREKLKRLGNTPETFMHILDTVTGIDIHPLAVITSKMNYLLALGNPRFDLPGHISIPVYLSNSIRPPDVMTTSSLKVMNGSLEHQLPGYWFYLENNRIDIPEQLIGSISVFDQAIELCKSHAMLNKEHPIDVFSLKSLLRTRNFALAEDQAVVYTLSSIAELFRTYIKEDRDTIWSFVLRNSYKPLFLRKRFDFVVGNPPWIVLRTLEPEYQEFLKEKVTSKDFYMLLRGRAELLTHLEIATFFMLRSADLYLKPEGTIGFVLPRSIITADQHDGLRKRSFMFEHDKEYKLAWDNLWDCEDVSPLFNIPSCVLIGQKSKPDGIDISPLPIPGLGISGHLQKKNSSLVEAKESLVFENVEFSLTQRGKRSYWSVVKSIDTTISSVYAKRFTQGASLVPRSMWFVKPSKPFMGFYSSEPLVETDDRAIKDAKAPYKGLFIQENVEKHHFYATLHSSDLLPFGFLELRMIVVPILPDGERFKVVHKEEARRMHHYGLFKYLGNAELEWEERRGTKAHYMDIYERIDRYKGLTSQNPKAKISVLYTTSGTNLASCIVDHSKIDVPGVVYGVRGFIADTKTYYYYPRSKKEALFLCSILNSSVINLAVKPMQSRGLWGARDFHKKVLDLPIPEFDMENPKHMKLAKLAEKCMDKVEKWKAQGCPGKTSVIGITRSSVRKHLEKELKEIDIIVKEFL